MKFWYSIQSNELDNSNNAYALPTFSSSITYAKQTKGQITLSSGTVWETINLGNVVTGKSLYLIANDIINIQIDGKQHNNTQNILFTLDFSSLAIQNNSGSDVTIQYFIYGN